MVSTSLEFSIATPEPGHRYGLAEGILARGDAHVVNVGLPTYTIVGVAVQFGAGGPFVPAPLSGRTWQVFGSPVARDTVLTVTARCEIHFLDGSGNTFAYERVDVIVGQLIPRVDIDPFDTDVTVTDPPYVIPEVTGSVTEPFTNVTNVVYQVDTESPQPVGSVVNGRWRATNVSIPAGRHTLRFTATDPFNSKGSSSVEVSVRVPIDPSEVDRVFAPTSYVNELLELARRYVTVDGAPPGPSRADLQARLHQPLTTITKAAAFRAATADVSQTRLGVEVLRGVIPPSATTDLDPTYRWTAYEALLLALGTSAEELRIARTGAAAERAQLAVRLGLEPSQPEQLAQLTLDRADVTDEKLAWLFGYQPTVAPSLEAPPPGTPAHLLAQQAALRNAWRETDARERDVPGAPRPLIVPGLVEAADLVSPEPHAPADALLTAREAWRAARHTEIESALAGTSRTQAGFDAAVQSFIGPIDLPVLAQHDRAGEDVSAELRAVGLDKPMLRRLDRLRTLAAGPLGDEEWAEITRHLLTVNARHEYATWRQQEVAAGIVLDPGIFAVRVDATPPGPDWRAELAARSADYAGLTGSLANAVAEAEARVLPQLRDALITRIGANLPQPEPFADAAERLSRALSFDLRAQRDARTTRVGQAIESLQNLFTTARSGSYRPELGVPVLQVANENNFDLEYQWLETYERWLSAMRAFAYPESQLHPQLYVPENAGGGLVLLPTEAYTGFLKALAGLTNPTPDDVRALIKTSYTDKLSNAPAGLVLTEQLDNAGLAARKTLCRDLVRAAEGSIPYQTESRIPQHLRELFWLVPVAAARKLQAAGHFVAALDWFQTVYAYHLPAASRPIYYGLVLEQNTESDYGRLPEWLSQVRELNPHFTARKRRGTYTRATVLSVVECFLDFADSVFAQDTPDSRARARALYQGARDLLELPEVRPEEGPLVPFPRNPARESLARLAEIGLAKVHAGLDIAGQPVIADEAPGNGLPSPHRYAVLIERAKTLVGIAQQVETAYLSALERLDGENYALLQAGRDLRIAAGTLAIQDLRVDLAANGIDQALLQRDRAQVQFDTYHEWIEAGLSDAEDNQLTALRVAEGLHGLAALVQLGGTLKFWDAAGTLAGALSEAAAVASTEAQIQQTKASFERRADEWRLNRRVAEVDVQLAQRQIIGARGQHAVAQQERQVAAEQLAHARAVAEFLATKFTNAELYDWMSGVLARVYAFFLQQATAAALLAQAQLAFERQEVSSRIILTDYWQPTQSGQGAPDRRGITGSARLLQDIFRLDQHAFETDRRKLHLSQTFSMAQVAAYELEQFRQTGVLTVATPQSYFDRDFPGQYLRLIRQVSVSIIALVPAGRGLRATMSASGVSRAVVSRDSFETVTLRREPEMIAFTAPINANGLFVLEPEGALLRPFEGMGVDTVWQLHLPKAANLFDYRGIADVLLTIEYTALESPEYRDQVIRSLDRSFSGDRSISLRDQLPDVWFELSNPDTVEDPSRRMRARVPIDQLDLPPHIDELEVAQLTVFVVRGDALLDEVALVSLSHTTPAGVTTRTAGTRTVRGIATTRRSGGAQWQALLGAHPMGTWDLQFEDTPQVRKWFADGLIEDVVIVFTLAGRTSPWI